MMMDQALFLKTQSLLHFRGGDACAALVICTNPAKSDVVRRKIRADGKTREVS